MLLTNFVEKRAWQERVQLWQVQCWSNFMTEAVAWDYKILNFHPDRRRWLYEFFVCSTFYLAECCRYEDYSFGSFYKLAKATGDGFWKHLVEKDKDSASRVAMSYHKRFYTVENKKPAGIEEHIRNVLISIDYEPFSMPATITQQIPADYLYQVQISPGE